MSGFAPWFIQKINAPENEKERNENAIKAMDS
jgi:hypothetical protein